MSIFILLYNYEQLTCIYHDQKWSKFQLYRVPLELDNKKWKKLMKKKNNGKGAQNDKKAIVSFKIASIPERRPYLLSRDYVFVRRSGKKTKFEVGIYDLEMVYLNQFNLAHL